MLTLFLSCWQKFVFFSILETIEDQHLTIDSCIYFRVSLYALVVVMFDSLLLS